MSQLIENLLTTYDTQQQPQNYTQTKTNYRNDLNNCSRDNYNRNYNYRPNGYTTNYNEYATDNRRKNYGACQQQPQGRQEKQEVNQKQPVSQNDSKQNTPPSTQTNTKVSR